LGEERPIVLVRRGGCNFVTKVRNAQLVGANLVIIVDNEFEATEYITMSDDGFGYLVKIPSVFIGEDDGSKIMDYIRNEKALSAQMGSPMA
jgi:hypothetical protein